MKTQQHRILQQGFTLMESVVALLLLSIASLGIIQLNGNLFLRSQEMRDWQEGTQILQACLDQVVAMRNSSGYSAAFDCDNLNTLGTGFTLSVNPNATVEYCPSGLQCKQIVISASKNGTTSTPISILFVNR